MTMESKQTHGRGRSVRPRKPQFEFSQYGMRSREPSPHIVRDRLTRYASPSRCCRHDDDGVVPRIPQPYQTSFSAVTSPRRALGTPANLGSQPLLDTSPSRSSPRNPLQARSCDMLSEPLRSPTPERVQTGTVKLDSGEWRDKMRHILGESKSSSDVLTPEFVDGKCCDNSKSSSDQATVDNESAANLDDIATEANPKTAVIKKEYTHAKSIVVLVDASYLANAENCCDEPTLDNPKKKRSRSRLRNFAARTRDSLKVLSGGSTSDSKTKDAARRQPSPQSADGRAPRLSNGISRMFQRISHISPKSQRNSGGRRSESCGHQRNGSDGGRHGNGSEGNSPNSSNGSLHVHDATDGNVHDTLKSPEQKTKCRKPSPIRQMFRRRFSGGKSSERNSTADGKENIPVPTMQQSPLPQESARILRTLDDGSSVVSPEKTVYQVFKEKQSNQRHTVADGKPKAVRATCSPTAGQASPSFNFQCKSPPECKTTPETGVNPVAKVSEEATRRRPNTLGVRDVTKINKGAFLLPSMSAESIGQCSLDVHSIGSGTSLPTQTDSVGSRQAVSTTASKYVLNSKASDDASTKSSEHTTETTEYPAQNKSSEHMSETAEQNKDCIVVAAAHGDTSADSGSSSGGSNHNDSVAVVAPTAVVTTCIPTRATDLTLNGFVVHNDDCAEKETNGDLVDSSCDVSKHNGVPHFEPHPPTSPKPERRFSPRDKRDVITVSEHVPVAIVTNGASNTVNNLTPGVECVNHEVGHVCDGSGEVAPLELTNTTRTAPVIAQEETTCKDGVYFKMVMQHERIHLDKLCDITERLLDMPIPDEVAGKMRATVGKARLLTVKKFKQFDGLCTQQMEQDSDEKFKTTAQDLEGFWDMVLLQVDDVYTMFAEIETLRRNGWIHIAEDIALRSSPSVNSDTKSNKSRCSGGKVKTPKPKEINSTKTSKQPAKNARDEARKRLLLAKRAGRQRKASQNETDVEIFVS